MYSIIFAILMTIMSTTNAAPDQERVYWAMAPQKTSGEAMDGPAMIPPLSDVYHVGNVDGHDEKDDMATTTEEKNIKNNNDHGSSEIAYENFHLEDDDFVPVIDASKLLRTFLIMMVLIIALIFTLVLLVGYFSPQVYQKFRRRVLERRIIAGLGSWDPQVTTVTYVNMPEEE